MSFCSPSNNKLRTHCTFSSCTEHQKKLLSFRTEVPQPPFQIGQGVKPWPGRPRYLATRSLRVSAGVLSLTASFRLRCSRIPRGNKNGTCSPTPFSPQRYTGTPLPPLLAYGTFIRSHQTGFVLKYQCIVQKLSQNIMHHTTHHSFSLSLSFIFVEVFLFL